MPDDLFLKTLYERGKRELKDANFSLGVVSYLKKILDEKFKSSKKRVILIGGTNGKGSTSYFLNSILLEKGIKTGLFTSPHLVSPLERIKINGKSIDDKKFKEGLKFIDEISSRELKRYKIDRLPTFFETIFLISLYVFYSEKCEVLIFEVGLGGRLDATNTLKKDIAFITEVSRDHEEYLGNRIEDIVNEKSGIFENSKVNLVGDTSLFKFLGGRIEIENIGDDVEFLNYFKIKPFKYRFDFFFRGDRVSFSPLAEGSFQWKNIRNALHILKYLEEILNKRFEKDVIEDGINKTVIPARFFKISEKPLIYIDGAHNISGFNTVKNEILNFNLSPVILFGAMKDKNILEKIVELHSFSSEIAFVRIENERSACYEDYRKMLGSRDFRYFSSAEEGYRWIKNIGQDNMGLIFGSLYLCGEILKLEKNEVI